LSKLYGKLLDKTFNTVSDAREWRKWFYVEDEENIKVEDIEEPQVDSAALSSVKNGKILCIGNEIFDVDMIYVDVSKGFTGAYMFYKFQLIHEPIRQLTILWCRWGRPGEKGNFQRTPYQDQEEAIKEFKKIFQQKTLNPWENRFRNQFIPKKWRLIRTKKRKNIFKNENEGNKDKTTPHHLVNALSSIIHSVNKQDRPNSLLPIDVYNFVNTIFDVAALKQSESTIGLSNDVDKIGMLSDQDLDKAYQLLRNLSEKVSMKDQTEKKTTRINKPKRKN